MQSLTGQLAAVVKAPARGAVRAVMPVEAVARALDYEAPDNDDDFDAAPRLPRARPRGADRKRPTAIYAQEEEENGVTAHRPAAVAPKQQRRQEESRDFDPLRDYANYDAVAPRSDRANPRGERARSRPVAGWAGEQAVYRPRGTDVVPSIDHYGSDNVVFWGERNRSAPQAAARYDARARQKQQRNVRRHAFASGVPSFVGHG